MAEGLFTPTQRPVPPGLAPATLAAALVRVLPRTVLALDWAASAEEARARARNEPLPDGAECWHRCFLRDDAARIHDPQFNMGMVSHEFARVIAAGGTLPVRVPLDGGGTGFAISPSGHVLTNYHLVTSEVANHARAAGVVGTETRCRTLRVQIAHASDGAGVEWRDADDVWLVSNPPEARAIADRGDGTGDLREDVALLRVTPAPRAFLRLDTARPGVGTPVWMAGFPLRTARAAAARERAGYADADGTLRVSRGQVTSVDGDDYFSTDCDGSMGNSGSPVLAASGAAVGLFSRATGDGPRNAFEYGHVTRIHVSAALAIRALAIRALALEGIAR